MKKISEITFGFSDAENYRRRENKDLFNRIFLRTEALKQIEERNIFFLVGEKGTGKTAYAVYFSNSQYDGNRAAHRFIRETDYQKFVELRAQKNLSLSDYTDIWKVAIYLLISEAILNNLGKAEFLIKYPKIKALKDAIQEYYDSAFSPEITTALQFVENSKLAAELMAKHLALSAKGTASKEINKTTNDSRFQTHLLTIQRSFEEALESLSINENQLLFIDGIDIRPSSVPYVEYLDCVKGLANAVWSVNNDFFPSVRDSKGRMRVVLLLRPDIFNSLGLQNRNTKLRDNSVVLDWRTVYFTHRQSNLFKMADRMFSAQQAEMHPVGECWDFYFPFNATNVRADESYPTSFVSLMRYSFHRPRDILTILDILGDPYAQGNGSVGHFRYEDLFSSDFKRMYGDYLLGEIKDSLSFYYDEFEFELFLKFFEYLDGAQKFNYDKYTGAFQEFSTFLLSQGRSAPGFMRSAEEFIQFLFDQNILCYIEETEEGEKFIRWCFIERSPSNISPKVKLYQDYEIHYGLANVLNTGKELRRKRRNVRENLDQRRNKIHPLGAVEYPDFGQTAPNVTHKSKKSTSNALTGKGLYGKIVVYNSKKAFGFIKDESSGDELFFHLSNFKEKRKPRPGLSVSYERLVKPDGKMAAVNVIINRDGVGKKDEL